MPSTRIFCNGCLTLIFSFSRSLLPRFTIVRTSSGWVYGQYVEAINDDTTAPFERASADGRYVTVVAIGQGTDRAKALEQAWIEAVRLAVGTIISSKSELNNDDFAESTIAHSRGVIDSFEEIGRAHV